MQLLFRLHAGLLALLQRFLAVLQFLFQLLDPVLQLLDGSVFGESKHVGFSGKLRWVRGLGVIQYMFEFLLYPLINKRSIYLFCLCHFLVNIILNFF
ncbi:MAG: hypothetical protein JO338_10940 [Aquitalea sp.]|nr:hypothetical protein [Aquitalea sp.]